MVSRVVVALLALVLPAATAAAAPKSLRDLGVSDGLTARGIDASATAFVPIPPGFALEGGTVDLRFEHSPLLLARRSTVTLVAGGVPVASARLTPENAQAGRLRAQLPRLSGARRGFTLAARFSMRLTRDDCEDPRNAALWARVLPETTVDLKLVPARRGLADALENLLPAAPDEPVDVVLPPGPQPHELAAAGTAAAAIGRAAAGAGVDPLLEVADRPGDRAALVLERDAAAPGTGRLESGQTGAPRIVLSGDREGLPRAAEALAASRLTPPTGRSALVDASPPPAPERARPWSEPVASFAQLGIETRELVGQGDQTVDLVIDRPPDWRIKDGAALDLRVVANAALRGETSTVTATVAGRDVGSQRLRAGAGPQQLRFDLPPGLVDSELDGSAVRSLPVALRFDLDVDRGRCVPVDADDARVELLDTSTVTLPHERTDARDLSRFPAPMRGRIHVVVPDDPSRAELAAGLQAAAAVGRWSDPGEPAPRLVTASTVEDARAKADALLIGDADEQLGRRLEVPGEPPLQPGEGLLALHESPWADGRTVLSARGGDEAGVLRAIGALTERASMGQLVGRAVVVRAAASPEAVAGGPGRPPLELAPVLQQGFWQTLPVWAIPAAVVLVMLLALIVVVARRRWVRPRAG